ncbi:bifunctional glycosyltransferase family 2 protein/CDP-glycerol:glycerophosphate glycerophosphotransferase [Actinomadura sp. ATCC 31491]|uniref:Bifunctional glycosyltransferase family 2 protein/CDP-glycerol:glycerophosphate glycerophosphotransferase n=1 Tax=Actinomadura luzonensis TaxID=2805427 RepID=A0ABT0GAC2_9ACTN|nr:CDP-glycerol glycerophosphotransferase family protein [Actinomadura luzonensis]MCK2221429.1 bifunctional glycosyltransferase family 2 protein/CDP-glycerol:glycerophosphate glycerophosphotransferase [Actinomadura luzonensis]
MPDCSVVVITYNDAARLPRAVRSVLGQSLRDLEVIIADDASTDGTPEVAARLMAEDRRVRYLRRPANSGHCGAPRNDGIDAAAAPYVMFLDSDDELPRHACKSLLDEIERTGAEFVSGQISRLYEPSGRLQPYYPSLFARRRVVTGIREDPELFLDSFSTNKLYDVAWLRARGLRFPEDLHYEDHVFAADLYGLAGRFAIVPWTVYHWHRARGGTSISLSVDDLDNVRQRVLAARLSDERLRAHGAGDLVPHRQRRFVRQDLRVYLNPLPARDLVWVKEFASIVRPYLEEVAPEVLAAAAPMERVCCRLILDDRVEDLRVAAGSLTGARAAPRAAVRQDGRTYWGTTVSPGLDITALRLAELPFAAARLRHEATELARDGDRVRMTVRTYDPFGVLPAGWTAFLQLGKERVPISPQPSGGGGYVTEVAFTPSGRCEPRIGFTRTADGHTTTDRVLVDPHLPPIELPGGRVQAEGYAAYLCVRAVPAARSRWRRLRRRLWKRVSTPRAKLRAYKLLIKVVRPRPDLALFESDVGKGCCGSPRALYEELRRRELPIEVVWSLAKGRKGAPRGARRVRRGSWRHVWTMARAGVWVDSHGFPLDYPKPRGTRYLQTWHGQGIKSIGFDAPDLRSDFDAPRAEWRAAVARWDALVSPSAEFSRIFVPSNGYTGKVYRHGTPRCDALVRGEPSGDVRGRLDIPPDRRILLYAPTYRDRAMGSGQSVRADLELLAEELAGEWVLVLRTHPVERYEPPEHLRHFVRAAGSYPDVNDLMLASDALLTDYSSVMCDYAITGKPMVFYIDDWDDYRLSERGVYHDLPAIAPGPCVTTTEELVDVLRRLEETHAAHAARYAAFRELWCADERGEAAARIVDDFFGVAP